MPHETHEKILKALFIYRMLRDSVYPVGKELSFSIGMVHFRNSGNKMSLMVQAAMPWWLRQVLIDARGQLAEQVIRTIILPTWRTGIIFWFIRQEIGCFDSKIFSRPR